MVWSLGNQQKLHAKIANLPMPIKWIVGEKDHRFATESRLLRFKNSSSKVILVSGQGHRINLETVAKITTAK